MLKQFKADLHIHTCLSPCANLQMTPSAIVRTASEKGLDIIAITDHNSAENVIAAKKAAEGTGLTVLHGMEITSAEEAHILALFDDSESAIRLQEIVYQKLMPGENDTRRFGDQIVVNEKDEVLGFNNRLLISATTLDAYSIVSIIHSFGGLAIASHVDRDAFGVISQLGFIPEDLKFDALEMSPRMDRKTAEHLFKEYNSFAWVSSSDAHYSKDIGRRDTSFFMKEPSLAEIALALKNIDGRKVEWE
ncbi:MAG: PHP domain-containing protein [Nitrospirae bacterium]|nr:PHP domain-containing protein [Nitrospirota bacterium]